MEQITERNYRIDTLKFLLIFEIYLFHCQTAAGRLYPFIGTYHVPAFFMVSGFWALKKDTPPLGKFLSGAWQRYLSPWFLWVVIYTVYHAVMGELGVRKTLELLVKYVFAVRGTGIGGMWFVPGFFLVTLAYRLLAALTRALRPRSRQPWAMWNLAAALMIWVCFRLSPGEKTGWLFSLNFVPEYLFYYALGAAGYGAYERFRDQARQNPRRARRITGLLYAGAAAWMVMIYFQKENVVWNWLWKLPGETLDFLPEVVTVVLALIGNYAASAVVSGKWTAALGHSTLILCCSEALMKNLIQEAGHLLGISAAPRSPAQAILFSLLSLAVGWYIAVPTTERVMRALRGPESE